METVPRVFLHVLLQHCTGLHHIFFPLHRQMYLNLRSKLKIYLHVCPKIQVVEDFYSLYADEDFSTSVLLYNSRYFL